LRKKQQREVIISKYKALATGHGTDLAPNPDLSKVRDQISELHKQSALTENTNIDALILKFEALGDVTPVTPILNNQDQEEAMPSPVGPVVLTEQENEEVAAPSLMRVAPEAVDVEEPLPTYRDKLTALLGYDADMLTFYREKEGDVVLHAAFGAVINLDILTEAVARDLLIISDYVYKKREEIVTRQLKPSVADIYTTSLDGFYQDALSIRLSDQDAKTQVKLLKQAASTHFAPRGAVRRFFTDAIIMISMLCITGAVVGSILIGAGLLTSSFFSQKPSTRKSDFEKRLNSENADGAESLLNGPLGPIAAA
jgi:hypothetical protein